MGWKPMNNDNVGRVAFVGILGVIGAVAITKPVLSGQAGVNEGIVGCFTRYLAD